MISNKEQIMYKVMKAIYEQGLPICFKGSMVLKACLLEVGYLDQVRHTVDIDANWNSDTPPTVEMMVSSLQNAIDQAGIAADVNIYRTYGESRSAGFEIKDRDFGEIMFTIDLDVGRPIPKTKIYEIEGIRFRGVAPVQMLADKISVVSCDKVFRRIKDVIDLYYLSRVFTFDREAVLHTMKDSGRALGDFHGFLYRHEELKHSYDKFRFSGDVDKPSFEVVYNAVRTFIRDVFEE